VKDIIPFVDDEQNYYKSFLVKKFHPKWAREHDIDTFIDELVDSYVTYGLVLVKDVNDVRPEVVELQTVAFCDQTDILSGAICIKHQFSATQLREMVDQGWDAEVIEQLITAADEQKKVKQANDNTAKTPSKYIEAYELHGVFSENWLTDDDEDEPEYVQQIQVISYLNTGKTREAKDGVSLFAGREKEEGIFKALKRDGVFGRACGLGGVEELFESQVWTNYSELKIKDMLDAAALMLLQTADKAFATQNKLSDLEPN